MAKKQQSGGYNPDLLPNTCQTPNVILDHWMASLSGSEFKVVMYAVRHTYGFSKKSDKISASQFAHGLTKKDGEVFNRGTGMHERTVFRALDSLVEKGILRERPNQRRDGGDDANRYSLNLQYLPQVPDEEHEDGDAGGSDKMSSPPPDDKMPEGGLTKSQPGGCKNATPQNPVSQNPTNQNPPKDLPSVDPSAHEGNPVDNEAGSTDRLTDGLTDENSSDQTSDSSTSVQLLEPEDSQHDEEQAPDLSPEEDEDNATLSAADALRQQAEAIPTSEICEEAQSVAREVLGGLPKLFPENHKRDRCRVGGLSEHYVRAGRTNVLRDATDALARQARKDSIGNPWGYLIACCVDVEKGYSEGDDELLSSLSGENSTSPTAESESAGYEGFFSESEQESDAAEDQQRQHIPDSDPEALAIWEKVLEDVSGEINAPSLRVWFEGTIPVSLSADTLTISVPNSFAKEYIESRFLELLEGALSKRLSPTSRIEIVVGVEGSTNNTAKRGTSDQEQGDG